MSVRAAAASIWAKRPWLGQGFAAWLWGHRTKALGTAGLAAGYVCEHQDKLGLFLSAQHVAQLLEVFGALGFAIGVYNTFFAPKVV